MDTGEPLPVALNAMRMALVDMTPTELTVSRYVSAVPSESTKASAEIMEPGESGTPSAKYPESEVLEVATWTTV